MVEKSRRAFVRDAGLGGTVLAGIGLSPGSAAAERWSIDDVSVADAAGDWPTFHGTADRSGYTSVTGPVTEPTARRLRESSPTIASNLAVVDGVAYFVQDGNHPTAVAFDLARESTVWHTDVTPGSDAGVTVDDGTVYVLGGSQQAPKCVPVPPTLTAIDADDGTVRWEHQFQPITATWPTVVDGTVYLVAEDEAVAVDSDGEEAWRTGVASGTGGDRSALPAVADGFVVVADDDGVVALDADDGAEVWQHDLHDSSTPAIADGTVYVTGRNGIVALNLADGAEQWRAVGSPSGGPTPPSGAPVVDDENVYVPMDESHVAAFSRAEGVPVWRSDHLGNVAIGVGGDTVYAADSQRHDHEVNVYAVDAADGATRWTHEPASTFAVDGPAITDGALLFGGETLTVLAGE